MFVQDEYLKVSFSLSPRRVIIPFFVFPYVLLSALLTFTSIDTSMHFPHVCQAQTFSLGRPNLKLNGPQQQTPFISYR